MKSVRSSSLILIFAVFTHVATEPNEFCLDHFDDGDCGEPPTSVFYYYKPGSRCEARTWKGCPTLNMFPDYFSCLHFCVGRIWGEPIIPDITEEAVEEAKTVNISEVTEAQLEWKEEIKTLEVEEIKVMDKILDEVIQEVEHQHLKLSFHQTKNESVSSETTTFSYPTVDSEYDISEEEILVP